VARVHNVRNAALVVVGDVSPAEVERGATILSRQAQSPAWVADLPSPPLPAARPPKGERMLPVITPRAGSLTDVSIGCLLPPLAAADRGHYGLLKNAIEARLNTALRIDDGDGYGVNVAYERLRGGTTYLVASTSVSDQILGRTLAVLRAHWARWARAGFEAGELNVARWRYAGALSSTYANTHALALQLLGDWSAEPGAVRAAFVLPDLGALHGERINELFATCKANAVLGLTGNEAAIHRALEQSWPGLVEARHPAP
jgi:predicted Zn-dependent peptidase